ncbi:hypothetical protein [Saccharibacillus endophyticus]|uniref:Uncharacterized protein n=1 Tax=Saccharibacillus endophyticus TaxID=2060666 RepID=A0ABQ1ZUI1_9BACL|nr:hypothetical protein [Saccharibacillus endophyticus]GGH79653.1 hypothetical protein GCM10007362_26770 [Saccharibacillus endophyticus]
MKTIKALSRYYYIGLVIGYFTKKNVLDWTDRTIEGNKQFPYELIEISLSSHKPSVDIASKLKQIYGEEILQEPLYQLLGELVNDFEMGRIAEEELFTYLSGLHYQESEIVLDEDLSDSLNRLDDAYYLASEGIYGDVKTVCEEGIDELNKYKEYIGRIKE